jgi:hypothetical protein
MAECQAEKLKAKDCEAVGPALPKVWAKHDEVRTSPDFGCN